MCLYKRSQKFFVCYFNTCILETHSSSCRAFAPYVRFKKKDKKNWSSEARNEFWDMLSHDEGFVSRHERSEGAKEIGQPLSRHCDAIGLKIKPLEDVAAELGQSDCLSRTTFIGPLLFTLRIMKSHSTKRKEKTNGCKHCWQWLMIRIHTMKACKCLVLPCILKRSLELVQHFSDPQNTHLTHVNKASDLYDCDPSTLLSCAHFELNWTCSFRRGVSWSLVCLLLLTFNWSRTHLMHN